MFELWFREMEATTDPSSPAFLRGVEAPSAPPTPVQVPGKGVFLRFTFAGLVVRYFGLWFLYVCELFGSRLSGYNWILDLNRMRNR